MSTKSPVKSRLPASSTRNLSESKSAQVNPKIAQEVHRLENSPVSKTHSAYWKSRVRKPAESVHFGVQIAFKGQRHRFPLNTANRETAADRARDRYLYLVANDWTATLAKFKEQSVKAAKPVTVGALIKAATRLSSARTESLDTYSKALRRITAAVVGLENGRKYDFKRGSHEWRAKVDATGLDKLTPAKVLAWKQSFLKSAKGPDERNRASITVNSLLRNSKALLSKKVLPFLRDEITLPAELWFQGIPLEEEPSMRYRSRIDAGEIMAAARAELALAKPEAFKCLLLTLICGLRRSEADSLEWSQINLEQGTLEVMDTEHKRLKSKDSAGVIGLDAELVAMMRGFKARALGAFVLETPLRARLALKAHKSRGYRCDATHETLIAWLKLKGVPGHRPIHTLRKEIGSIIATRDGIFKASRYLRHSDIRITAKLYADPKIPVTAGLGALLADVAEPGKVLTFQPEPQIAPVPVKAARKRRA